MLRSDKALSMVCLAFDTSLADEGCVVKLRRILVCNEIVWGNCCCVVLGDASVELRGLGRLSYIVGEYPNGNTASVP